MMRFKGLDLNLLVAFEALMETRSVSRAAEHLNLSQPAMSAALGRLRTYFEDMILVVHGKRMLPTPYAESLRPQVRECLRGAEAVIATASTFDPATSQRIFRLVASDYATAAILTPLIHRLAGIAPLVGMEIMLPDERVLADLDEGRVDMLITPEEYLSSAHPTELLFEERHVVVGCASNPYLPGSLTEAAFFDSGHISVSIGRHRQVAYGDQHMQALGKHRRVEIVVPSFTLIPWLLIGTNRLALMHERLARAMAIRFPIAFAPIPFDFPLMREMAQYHNARAGDDGLRWLLNELRLIADPDHINYIDPIPLT